MNINKKIIVIIAIIAIVAVVAVVYMMGYISIGKPVTYRSEREASEAITNISSGVEQIGSIIEDISKRLGG